MSEGGTVGKAMTVLDQVAGFGRPVRFAEILSISELPKATLYRLLQTLVNQSLLTLDADSGTYGLGVRLVRLAHAAWQQSSLAPVARPWLDSLSADLGETVHLAQLDNAQVLYIDKRNAVQPVEMFSDAGKVGPAYCTGVGKAMLAYLDDDALQKALGQQSYHRFTGSTLPDRQALQSELDEIRREGVAFDREEHEPGIICIAAPILAASGRILGAISVTSPTSRMTLNSLAELAPRLKDTAAKIARDADTWRFPETGRRTG